MTSGSQLSVRATFDRDGFAMVGRLLEPDEVPAYRDVYGRFLNGEIDTSYLRVDLGVGEQRRDTEVENITQIMWPSVLHPEVKNLPLYDRGLAVAKELIGDDAELDFDMLINKAPGTATPTPWHQDAAYWVDLPDKRAASIWVALDDAEVDNGCMWYVRGSHLGPLRPHRRPAGRDDGALECDCSENEPGATPVPLAAGQAAAHAGGTLHYSRGNTTADRERRAYILSFRPGAMIALGRERGLDHGLQSLRKNRGTAPGSN